MKKIVISTGFAAVGAIALQPALAANMDSVSPKAWSVSGTLREFYDDNYNTSANNRQGSWGTELTPTIAYNLPLQQTDLGIRYTYGLYYYQNRLDLHENPFDQTHQVDLWLDHAINERWKVRATDTFSVGQEPELLQTPSTPYRVNGNNLANHANFYLDTQWTKEFGTSLHYGNDFYNYQNRGFNTTNSTYSLAGKLNRTEQRVGLDGQWTFDPQTMVFAGYTYSWSDYYGNEVIGQYLGLPIMSDARNNQEHEAHVGLQHQLTANLSLSGQLGVQYSTDNNPYQKSDYVSPTASFSASYTYAPGSYIQLGVSQSRNATDIASVGTDGSITQDQNTTAVYADINHKLTEKLMVTGIARYSYSYFEGGAESGADKFLNLGLNLSYAINRHLSADIGYNFDQLFSQLDQRGFTRNRGYMGLTASF